MREAVPRELCKVVVYNRVKLTQCIVDFIGVYLARNVVTNMTDVDEWRVSRG